MSEFHWYNKNGEPDYGHTVKKAIEKGLYPSVTTILGVLDKPGLNYWKQEQCILTADKNKRFEDEDDKTYSKRVMALFGKNQFSASVGTMIHAFCENKADPLIIGYDDVCTAIRSWQNENLSNGIVEESFTYEECGYGGRIDWYGFDRKGRKVILDYKTQGPKKGALTVYDEWIYQLSAYSKADIELRHLSIVISSDNSLPLVMCHEWTKEEIVHGYEVFNAAKTIWYRKNFK